jgi:hypothetical protein
MENRGGLMVRGSVLSVWLALATQAQAWAQDSWRWMNDAEIAKAFANTTIMGEYIDLSTFTETYKPDGVADYTDQRGEVRGVWSVVNNHFCTIYESDITGGCFRGVQRSSNCYEFYSSTATPAETAQPPSKGNWVARAWRTDRPSTCVVETV